MGLFRHRPKPVSHLRRDARTPNGTIWTCFATPEEEEALEEPEILGSGQPAERRRHRQRQTMPEPPALQRAGQEPSGQDRLDLEDPLNRSGGIHLDGVHKLPDVGDRPVVVGLGRLGRRRCP